MTDTRNPYAAPAAAVDDVDSGATTLPLHPHVRLACRIMWWSLAFSLLTSPLSVSSQRDVIAGGMTAIIVGLAFGLVFGALITWWVVTKLQAGRNWMRLLVTVLSALWIVGSLVAAAVGASDLAGIPSRPLELALAAVSWGFTLVEVVLINTPSARAWFAAMKSLPR